MTKLNEIVIVTKNHSLIIKRKQMSKGLILELEDLFEQNTELKE